MRKRVVIIEGCDNVGKDSLIESLKNDFNNPIVIHSSVPSSNDLFSFYYDGLIHNTFEAFYDNEHDAIIHNRSMYGEYVYGPKYRNLTKDEAKKLISKLELGQLKTFMLENELFLILLTSDNTDLLLNNDDGKSLSNKKSDIDDELKAFDEIFNLSKIKNKKRVYVNNGAQFKNKNDIHSEVINFINGVK